MAGFSFFFFLVLCHFPMAEKRGAARRLLIGTSNVYFAKKIELSEDYLQCVLGMGLKHWRAASPEAVVTIYS